MTETRSAKREMNSVRWVLLGLLAAAIAAVAFLPLRLAVTRLAPGLEADSIEGSIWNGRLRNARWEDVPLGDLDVGLSPRSLLRGKADLGFARLQPRLAGTIGGNRRVQRIDGLNGDLLLTVLPAPIPDVDLAFSNVSVVFDTVAGCVSAEGSVRAQLKGLPLIGDTPPLSGSPRCDEAAMFVPLAADGGQAALDLWLWRDGRYRAGLRLDTGNRFVQLALIGAGFRPTSGGVTLLVEGRAGERPVLIRG